eukprot:894614-Prorocentrum_lima.AAC.1
MQLKEFKEWALQRYQMLGERLKEAHLEQGFCDWQFHVGCFRLLGGSKRRRRRPAPGCKTQSQEA